MKVLIIEDDPILQDMYKHEFVKSGIEVLLVDEGKKGIIEAAKFKPDFILLDIMMPGMDGATAYTHLRELPETKDIPVAFLTVVPVGVPQALNKDPKMLEGAVGYWNKDQYTPMEIVDLVREYLHKESEAKAKKN